MKQRFIYAIFLINMLMATACSSGDDGNEVSIDSKPLVGYWEVPNINSNKKNPTTYCMVLFPEGKMHSKTNWDDKSVWGSASHEWTYNEDTGILATTAQFSSANLQWLITLISADSWTGLELWNDEHKSYIANGVSPSSDFQKASEDKIAKAIEALLMTREWRKESEDGSGSLFFGGVTGGISTFTIWFYSTYHDELYSYSIRSQTYQWENFKYDKKNDAIYCSRIRKNGVELTETSFTFEHPFNYTKARIRITEKCTNYNNDMSFDYTYVPKL